MTPEAVCSLSVSCWWVVEAGWITRVLASPTLARCDDSLTPLMKAMPTTHAHIHMAMYIKEEEEGRLRREPRGHVFFLTNGEGDEEAYDCP